MPSEVVSQRFGSSISRLSVQHTRPKRPQGSFAEKGRMFRRFRTSPPLEGDNGPRRLNSRNSLLHFSRGSRRSFPLDERLVKLCSHDRGSSAKSGKHISRVKKVGLRCETKYSCDSQDRGPFRRPIACQDAGVISHCDGLCWRYMYF